MDEQKTKLQIGTVLVTVPGLHLAIKAAHAHMEALFANVTSGTSLPQLNPSSIVDCPHDTSLGYSFLQGTFPSLTHGPTRMLEDWIKYNCGPVKLAPNWRQIAESRMDGGDFPFEKLFVESSIWTWLDATDDLLEYIFFIFHVGCGQPGRGTEVASMVYVNVATTVRNVYWRGERFMFQTWYHKGLNMTNREKPRQVYLTGRLSQILYYYLGYIRPIQMCVAFSLYVEVLVSDLTDVN